MNLENAEKQLSSVMKIWDKYGSRDSEGLHAYDRILEAGNSGKPYPLSGDNPFDIYESMPGWKNASLELDRAGRRLWKALIEQRLGIRIR